MCLYLHLCFALKNTYGVGPFLIVRGVYFIITNWYLVEHKDSIHFEFAPPKRDTMFYYY